MAIVTKKLKDFRRVNDGVVEEEFYTLFVSADGGTTWRLDGGLHDLDRLTREANLILDGKTIEPRITHYVIARGRWLD